MYEESVKMLASRLKLRNTSILVTGATGLIGSCVIDVLAKANDEYGANIKIYALSRSKNKIEKDFMLFSFDFLCRNMLKILVRKLLKTVEIT